jgi:hypothetical protein
VRCGVPIRRFGHTEATKGFSLHDFRDHVRQYHRHPAGEVDLEMPISAKARFDGHAVGWVVYEAALRIILPSATGAH